MNAKEYQKGRIEALSVIVRAIVTALAKGKPTPLGPPLIRLANQYFLDNPPEMHTPDSLIGFQNEVKRIVATLDAPEVELSPPEHEAKRNVPFVERGGEGDV